MSQFTNGKFLAKPTQRQLGQVPTTGTPFVEVLFELLEGPQMGDRIRWTGYLSEKAQPLTFKALWAMGWQDDLEDLSTLTQDVIIDIQDEEREGRVFSRVRWVNSPRGSQTLGEGSALDASTLKSVAAAAKAARAAAIAAGEMTPSAPAARRSPQAPRKPNGAPARAAAGPIHRGTDPDDEIPF